jgi:hypothetical protein
MIDQLKEAADIVPADFQISPVWEYALDRECEGDVLVRPIFDLPVETLDLRFVGSSVRLANGRTVPSKIANVAAHDPYATRQFICLSVFADRWFSLARYFDPDIERNGPTALAAFLGLTVEEVFPILYDLRPYCNGDQEALSGTIDTEPSERLSDREIMRLVSR